jgi:hypothetical protein
MATEFKRVEYTILKPAGVTDTRLVPAVSTINVYFDGAYAKETKTIGTAPTTVAVDDVGDIKVADTLEKFNEAQWPSATNQVTVVAVLSQTSLSLQRISVDVDVVDGTRFVIVSRATGDIRPRIYSDDAGTTLLNSLSGGFTTDGSVTTNATTGSAAFFIGQRSYDAVVTGTGLATKLYADQEGGQAIEALEAGEYGAKGDNTEASAAVNTAVFADLFRQAARTDGPVGEVRSPRGTTYFNGPLQMDAGQAADGGGFGLRGRLGSVLKLATAFVGTRLFYIGNDFRHDTFLMKGQVLDGNLVAGIRVLEMARGAREVIITENSFRNWNHTVLYLGRPGGNENNDAVTRIIVEKNFFNNLDGAGASIIANSCASLVVSENIVDDLSNNFLTVSPAVNGDFARQITVAENIGRAASGWAGSFVSVVGRATDSSLRDGLDQSYSLSVTGNQIDGCRGVRPISISNYQNAIVEGNILINCGGSGGSLVLLSVVRNGKVRGNVLDGGGSTSMHGIEMSLCQYSEADGNTIYDVHRNGVLVSTAGVKCHARSNTIEHVNKDNSASQGGVVAVGVNGGVYSGNSLNDCSATAGYGAIIGAGCVDCGLSGNNLKGNGTGTFLDSGTGTVYGLNVE